MKYAPLQLMLYDAGLVLLDHNRSYWKTDGFESDLSEMYVHLHLLPLVIVYCLHHRPLQSLSVDPGDVSRETTPDPIHPCSETSVMSELDLRNVSPEPVSEPSAT